MGTTETGIERARWRIGTVAAALAGLLVLQLVLIAVQGGTSHRYGLAYIALMVGMLVAALLARAAQAWPRGAVAMFCVAGVLGVGCMAACTVVCGEEPWILAVLPVGLPIPAEVFDLNRAARRAALALMFVLLILIG